MENDLSESKRQLVEIIKQKTLVDFQVIFETQSRDDNGWLITEHTGRKTLIMTLEDNKDGE